MEKLLITIINALGGMGKTGVHFLLDKLEAFIVKTTTLVDNAIFYKVIEYIKSWEPKHPPEE